MNRIPCAWDYRAYVSVWQEEGALCVERVVVFHILQLLIPDYATLNNGCTGL